MPLWTSYCDTPTIDLGAIPPCTPAGGGGVGGPIMVTVDGALQSESPFACACDAAGVIQGWVFNVIDDDLNETGSGVTHRSLGFRDTTGTWTGDWVIPSGWELKNCTPDSGTVNTPVVVTPPDQPCIAVNGTVDLNAFLNYVDGVPTYFNLTGQLDPANVELLDPCDDRCVTCCDDPDAFNGGLTNAGSDCDCDCGPEMLAGVAVAVGGMQ